MPNWKDLRRYLDRHAEFIRDGRRHLLYKFKGKRIRISKGSSEISADLWKHILKHDLKITQEEFNAEK